MANRAGEAVAVSWWVITRDLVITCTFLVGYGWLAVLSIRVRMLSRRLGTHICREPNPTPHTRTVLTAAETTQPLTAAYGETSDRDSWRGP